MLEPTIENLLKTCDPYLNNEERKQNFLILDNYQKQLFQLDHLKTFLNPSSNQQVKIFGLKCLENFILYKWNTADKITTRGYLIEIIKEYSNFNVDNESERVIRWIIAKSVMYFIRHECPQNCDNIIMDLIHLKNNGIMTQALVLSIFYCLSECLPIDSQMPDKRKKEVIGYLTENYENIIKFSLEILKSSNNNEWYSLIIKLESVKTIQSFAGWIKFESLCKLADDIFSILIQCLNVNNCDYYILETIETMLERKTRVEDKYLMLNILINNESNWYNLLINIETGLQLAINPYSDEKFRYLQKIMDLLLVMGNIFINCWMKFSQQSRSICFDKFINSIQMATAYPVKILAIELLSFWYNGFKIDCENLRTTLSSRANFLLPLLKIYSMKRTIRDPSNVDHEYLLNLIEQKDEENYVNRIRYEASRAISSLTEHFTQGIITLCLDMVYSAILDIQQKGELSTDSKMQLEASRFFCRCVMHNVLRPYSKNLQDQVKAIFTNYPTDIVVKGKNTVTTILRFDNSDAEIVMIYTDLLCLLIPFVADQEEVVKECLEKIFIWFHIHESVDPKHLHYGLWRQVNKNCGVCILRIFRDYHFLLSKSLFETILIYYQSKCQKLYENPIIVEAMTIYIRSSSNYTVSQQEIIFVRFFDDIKSVLLSQSCASVFENGNSVVNYLRLNYPAPVNELSPIADQDFKHNVVQAIFCLYGICCRISSETENNVVNTKSPETISIISCPLYEHIRALLPSLLKIIRAINQVWSSSVIHAEFSSLKEISDYYKDTIINNKPAEKIHPNNSQSFAQLYVNSCRNFISRLHESTWLILAKCCLNYSGHLYYIKEWPQSVIEYVFSDLDSLPNFKLNPLIKSFVIPFVTHCPLDRFEEVMSLTVLPFINYTFQRLHEQWSTIETDSVMMEDADFDEQNNDGNSELCNEIIEEQVLRMLTKSFCELIRLTFTIGSNFGDDSVKGLKFGVIVDRLFQTNPNEQLPVMLMILNNVCRSITWKDSFCCAKLSLLIQPIVNEVNSRGLLNIDIVIFIFQQLICALNLFSSGNFIEIKISLLNLGVSLYDDFIAKDSQSSNRFVSLLDKSSEQLITTFQNKMAGKLSLKVKREVLEKLLQPYIRVSINKLFSQEVFIKDLPPLLKPHWKTIGKMPSTNHAEDLLCLEDLFKH